MWTCLFFVLLFHTAVLSSPPHPTNVTFTSVNLRNILQWTPGKDTPADTKYRVRYAIYGDSKEKRVHWRPVLHCADITRTWCDLSEETSDLEHGYYGKVRATSRKRNSEWAWTHKRFDPKIDTEFGPPHISAEVDDKYVFVTIKGPMKYLLNNNTPQVSMATLYHHMMYNLTVHNTRTRQIRHFTLTNNQYNYRIMDHGAEICFSAKTLLKYMPAKHHPSAWLCITTPEAPLIDRLERIVIISTAVPAVLLCLLATGSYLLYKYLLGTDQMSPVNLLQKRPTFFPPPLPVQSERVNVIFITVPKNEVPIEKLYPELSNPIRACEAQSDADDDCGSEKQSDDVVKSQNYKPKEWQIVAESSGSTYASQNSFLQTHSSSDNEFMNQPREDREETVGSSSADEEECVVSSGYASQNVRPPRPSDQFHDLPDDYGFVGYAAQSTNQSDLLPDDYGFVGLATADEAEDTSCLQLDWSPTTQRLIIPGLDFGKGRDEGGSAMRSSVHLDTVFVRQPSEEEALLGLDSGASDEWEPEEFMAKYDLVLSHD